MYEPSGNTSSCIDREAPRYDNVSNKKLFVFFTTALAPARLDPTSSLAIEDDFNDEEAWGEIKKQSGTNSENINNDDDDFDDDDDDSDVTISDIFPLVTSTPPAHLKGAGRTQRNEQAVNGGADPGLLASTPPTSALVTKLFPQLKPKQKPGVSRQMFLPL